MRNLKRSLAMFIVFALVTSIMLPAFAQDYTYSDQFDKLYQLGLIDGTGEDSDGNPIPSLDDSLTRETGIVMLVKMFVGEDKINELEAAADTEAVLDEAKEMVEAKFIDADEISEWAIPYIAYALSEEMVEGRPVEDSDMMELAPSDNLSGRDFATMFLRQLGYEVTGEAWEEACFTLQEKGGLTEDEAELFNTKALLRDDMVGIAYGSLFAENSDGQTLIYYLVETAKVVDGAKANELGIIYKEVKSVKTPDDVAVELDGTPEMPATVEVTFDDDTTANVPVMWDSVNTSEEGTFDVNGTIDGYSEAVTVKVMVQPKEFVLNEATATNLKEVVVKFNRALDKTTAETVTNYGGGLSTPTSATLQEDGKTVLLLSSTTLNANQSYTLTVANVKDSAGNVITSTSKAFTPVDKEVPQISSVTAKGNSKVVAVFSEPVQNVSNAADQIDNFKIDGYNLSSLTGTPVLGTDLKTVTITTDSPLLAGNHVLTLSQGDTTDVTDYAGYAAAVSAHEFEVVNDVVIPEVSSVEAPSQTEVNITFSEAVDTPALANVFWNTSGSESDNSKSADSIADKGNNMWTASFTQKSPIVKYLTAGQTVYFFVKDVEDLSGNKIAGNHATNIDRFQVTVPTNEVPTVASVTPVSDKQIDVLFTGMVDSDTVTSSNFVVKNSSGSTMTGTPSLDTVTTSTTYKKKVSIAFSTALTGGTYTVSTTTGVKDIVGNYLAASENSVTITDSTQPGTAAVAYKGTNVVLTYPEDMSSSGTYSASDVGNYKWYDATNNLTKALPSGTYITKISAAVYRINFPAGTVLSATDKIVIGYFDSSTLKTVADVAGNLYSPGETAAFGAAKSDMDISSTTGAKLDITSTSTLVFTLPTDQSTLSSVLATNFEITVDNGTNWFTPASALLSTDGKTVTFTVPDTNLFTSSNGGTNVDVRTVADPAGTKDVFDSKVTGSKTTVLTTKNSIAAKLLTFAVKDSSTIYLQTDGKLAASQNDELQASIQVIQGGVIKAISSISPATSTDHFVITMTDSIDPTVDVTIKTLSADYITATDVNGNKLAANTTGITLNKLAAYSIMDNQAGATVAANETIAVKFNRVVDPTSIKTDWDGTETAVTITYKTTGAITIGGVNVGTVAGATIAADSTVAGTIAYSAETLTIKFGANDANVNLSGGNLTFTPNANIKTTSGALINSTYVAAE
jgi:hypothetical protein